MYPEGGEDEHEIMITVCGDASMIVSIGKQTEAESVT